MKRWVLGALALLSVVAPAAIAEPLRLPGAADLARLDPAVQGTLAEAIDVYRSLPEGSDEAARIAALDQLSRTLHAHDQVEFATAAYDARLALRNDPATRYLRALLRLGVGDLDAALDGFDRAVQGDPSYAPALLRRADLHLERGALQAAAADFRAALTLQPGSAAALAGLGRVALQEGDAQGAADRLAEALALQPEAGRLRTPLALALRRLGRIDEARSVLAQRNDRDVVFPDPLFEAVASRLRNPSVLYEQGRTLADAGQWNGALGPLQEAVALSPGDPIYLAELGRALHGAGQPAEAELMLARAWQADSGQGKVAELRARIALSAGQPDAAIDRLTEALSLLPEADDLRVELARLSFRRGDYRRAATEFDALAERVQDAELSYALYWAGLAHAMLGQCEPAHARLQRVFDLSAKRDGWAMLGLSRLRALCPVTDALRSEGRSWAETLFRQHPGIDTAVTLALHHAAAGEFPRAIELQDQAIEAAASQGESLDLREALQADRAAYRAGRLPGRAYQPGSALLRVE